MSQATITKQPSVEQELAKFTTRLIENAGGIIDWQAGGAEATAIVPEELAETLGQHEDTFAVTTKPADNALTLSLGGEFIDLAGRVLRHFIPVAGTFNVEEIPIRKTEFASIVEASFGWQNARSKILEARAMAIPYHAWWFHVTLQSEETWEALIPITLNAQSHVPVSLGDLLNLTGLKPLPHDSILVSNENATLNDALLIAEAETMQKAAPFLQRIDARRDRDRKRLKDYYQAMLRESSSTNKRVKQLTPEELQSRQKAVKLELQRKLSELDDRYQVNATLRPVVLAELRLSAVAVDVEIQRKSQKRVFRLYWNSLLKQMEPMACSQCEKTAWNFWFSNDTVDPVCSDCHESSLTPH